MFLSSVTHAEDKGEYPQAGVYGEGDLKSLYFFESAIPVSPIRRYVQPLISARSCVNKCDPYHVETKLHNALKAEISP